MAKNETTETTAATVANGGMDGDVAAVKQTNGPLLLCCDSHAVQR